LYLLLFRSVITRTRNFIFIKNYCGFDSFQLLCNRTGIRILVAVNITATSLLYQPLSSAMFKNYFTIAWRNMKRRPFHSFLNLSGICIGLLFTMLISAYIWGELQVNKKLRNASQQYFLTSEWRDPNMGIAISTLGPLAKRLKEDYPSLVANYYRGDYITSVVSRGDRYFRESISVGDSTLLNMYGFELMYGNAATALQEPFSVVIKKEVAIKYFGRLDIVGETIGIQNFSGKPHDFKITGVLKDIPENSVTDLNIDNHHQLFIPASSATYFPRPDRENWANTTFPSYIELRPGVTADQLAIPIKRLIDANTNNDIKQNLVVKPLALSSYYIQKDNGLVKRLLYALGFTGIFILLMAAVTLSTSPLEELQPA